jgi:hypothetical protein
LPQRALPGCASIYRHPPQAHTCLLCPLAPTFDSQVLLELVATRREESGGGSRYASLAVLESIK